MMSGAEHSLHGVLLVIDPPVGAVRSAHFAPCGVLLRGEPGIGKSHCALALLDRGHALVADDAPLFTRHEAGYLLGRCPASIQDRMEVRGLGVINVRELLGADRLLREHRLDVMIELSQHDKSDASLETASLRRLEGDWRCERIFDVSVPVLTLRAQSASMLALLIETAVRDFQGAKNSFMSF